MSGAWPGSEFVRRRTRLGKRGGGLGFGRGLPRRGAALLDGARRRARVPAVLGKSVGSNAYVSAGGREGCSLRLGFKRGGCAGSTASRSGGGVRGGARGGGVAGEKRADDATGRAQRRSGGARGLCDGARAEMEGGCGRPEECAGEQWRMEEEGNRFIPLAKGTESKIQPVPM